MRVAKSARLVFIALLMMAVPVVYAADINSAPPDKLSFTEQCPKLFATADDFAHECLEKAHSMEYITYPHASWFFKGTPVILKNYAYMRPVDTSSHFGLGCSLDDKRQIEFLGVFYSTESSNFAIANNLPIFRALGGDGNILFEKDAHNALMVFEFIRPFETNSTKPIMFGSVEGIKNCENAELPDGQIRVHPGVIPGERLRVYETQDQGGYIRIKTCFSASEDSCQSAEYQKLFSGNDHRIIHRSLWGFVTDDGNMLVEKDFNKKGCPSDPTLWRSDLCTMLNDKPYATATSKTEEIKHDQ